MLGQGSDEPIMTILFPPLVCPAFGVTRHARQALQGMQHHISSAELA
jgi:hypothetical protein